MLDTALYEEPQFEVLIELHCRATGVFGVPALLRGLVDTISHVLISNQTTHEASFVGVSEGLGLFG